MNDLKNSHKVAKLVWYDDIVPESYAIAAKAYDVDISYVWKLSAAETLVKIEGLWKNVKRLVDDLSLYEEVEPMCKMSDLDDDEYESWLKAEVLSAQDMKKVFY